MSAPQVAGGLAGVIVVDGGDPTNRTVNGQLKPTIHIRPGEVQLWRPANISANIYYKLRLRGQRFTVVGRDGFPVDTAFARDTLVLEAGARFDVLVTGGPAGRTVLETLPYDTGPAGGPALGLRAARGPQPAPDRRSPDRRVLGEQRGDQVLHQRPAPRRPQPSGDRQVGPARRAPS
ncbi:hypothetical protein ACWEQC_29265 [Streptomyces shenzhenensis]